MSTAAVSGTMNESVPAQEKATTALPRLAEVLSGLGFEATLKSRSDRTPYLQVSNPRASILHEAVYARDGAYWWSWRERIAGWDEVATAAGILARVLRTVGE